MLNRVCSMQNAINQEPAQVNQVKKASLSHCTTYRKEIPNSMSNKDFIFDDFGHSFLNIHKFWCYPQPSMLRDPATGGGTVILLLTIACMKIT